MGDLVIFTGYTAFSSTVSANTVIFKGLPKAKADYNRQICKANGTQCVTMYVSSTNGDVVLEQQVGNGSPNTLVFNVVYFAKD